jgi:NAD(P)-dependent dehydrogenase (short-subunit alcohol dehydrogenase family)
VNSRPYFLPIQNLSIKISVYGSTRLRRAHHPHKEKEKMKLKGKTAVITGASGQLGSGIALALGLAGCNCICHYNRNKQKAEEIAEQIEKKGSKAMAVRADLTSEEQIEQLFEQAGAIGTPQILINSAAVFSRQPISEISYQQAQKVINTNLIAPILTSKVFAKKISDKFKGDDLPLGKIINIADLCGLRPWADYVLYCSSKAGLIGATKALAKELAPAICVNAVAPGIVNWPDDFDEAKKQRQLSLIPLKRIAEPQEIAHAVISLLENDYITGQVLSVDGGRSI